MFLRCFFCFVLVSLFVVSLEVVVAMCDYDILLCSQCEFQDQCEYYVPVKQDGGGI